MVMEVKCGFGRCLETDSVRCGLGIWSKGEMEVKNGAEVFSWSRWARGGLCCDGEGGEGRDKESGLVLGRVKPETPAAQFSGVDKKAVGYISLEIRGLAPRLENKDCNHSVQNHGIVCPLGECADASCQHQGSEEESGGAG